jgi:hypothetical protein
LGWAALGIYLASQTPTLFGDAFFYWYFGAPALVIYALGRAIRYVLAGD